MSPKRVLIGGFTDNCGGMENYIMNIYRNIDRTKLQFDFLYPYENEMAYSGEIKKMGGHIYHVPMIRRGLFKHFFLMRKLFSSHSFEGLYYQCTRKLRTIQVFKYAKKYDVKKRVIHSHSTSSLDTTKMDSIRINMVEKKYDKYVTDFFSCSDMAGKWMFGNKEYKVINNGIDTSVFKYNEDIRVETRTIEGIPQDAIVLGAVGRLSREKNPLFLVDMFKKFHDIYPNSYFLHIGDGDLFSETTKKIAENNLQDSFILKGKQKNVAYYLNAMDVMLLPSLYEGFPIVLVEAQSTGLLCLASSNVTSQANILGLVKYCSIDNVDEWIELIEKELSLKKKRYDRSDEIEEKGFGVIYLAQMIQDYFLK